MLTAENPSVPLRDESLLAEIPASTMIRTAKTFEPSYAVKKMVAQSSDGPRKLVGRCLSAVKGLARRVVNGVLQPDTGILWYPRAVQEGLRALKEQHHDVIVVSAPPFSSLLAGAALSRKTGVPLVVDYRDEWTISNRYWENKRQGPIGNWVQRKMQNHVLRSAEKVVATTPRSAQALAELARAAGSKATATHIYNGFDPSDFPATTKAHPRADYGHGTDCLRITFVGTLWTMTSIEPFVKAVQWIADTQPSLLDRLEVVVAGRQVGEQISHLERLQSLPCHVVNLGFVNHNEAMRLMMESDCLLQLLSDLPGVDRVIASKLFEYIGARRPILAITGQGDHWDVVSDLPQATVHTPDDVEGIAASIVSLLATGTVTERMIPSNADASIFERRRLTGQLAALLNDVAEVDNPEQTVPVFTNDAVQNEVPV